MTGWFKALSPSDRYTLVGTVLVPLVLWWFFIGRKKFNLKGLR
jgi:hypothetical protein